MRIIIIIEISIVIKPNRSLSLLSLSLFLYLYRRIEFEVIANVFIDLLKIEIKNVFNPSLNATKI